MLDFLITLLLFNLTIWAIPLFVLSYIVLRIVNICWLTALRILYPSVEFLRSVTVRTLLDTHRNQGIICVLLSVKGPAEPEAVRRHLNEVVRRRDKSGNLAFPRLRHNLVTKCGNYAWQASKFDLDQNLTVASFLYKGRPITDLNIQDYVSEIVSKYLPAGIPPWQVIIIPSTNDQHYILVKLHHLLLSGGLNIGDLLPLIPPTRSPSGKFASKSPLVEVLPKPKAIPQLKEKVTEELTNLWNEFVSNYDPLECTDLLKSSPGFFEFQAILLVMSVSTIKDCKKSYKYIKNDWFSQMKYLLVATKREAEKRQVNLKTFSKSILITLNPINIIKMNLKILFGILWNIIQIPKFLLIELVASFNCIVIGYCNYSQTLVGALYNYVPLIISSIKELFYYFSIIFRGPKTIIQDILLQKESFQTITLCGRKSVAWSEPVKMDLIQKISKYTNMSATEIYLGAVSTSLSKYFMQIKHIIPKDLPITVRNVNSNYIFGTGYNVKPEDSVSGILCVNLPMFDPEKDFTYLENLVQVKNNFREALDKQGLSHLLSLLQTKFGVLTNFLPHSLLSVYLKYLSRKYAVTVTEITSRYPNVKQKTIWGQEVTDAVYWRPPQANTSVSLCLNEYADHVKLSVMCDSQLTPHHVYLVRGFSEYIEDLVKSIDLQ